MSVDIDNKQAIIAALIEIASALSRPKALSVRKRERYSDYLRELIVAMKDEEESIAALQAELEKIADAALDEALAELPDAPSL